MIFGVLNPEKIWHKILQICPPHLSDVATLPCDIQKSHSINSIVHTYIWLFTLSQKKNYNPLAHPTWNCHHTNSWIAKLFHLTEGLLRSFKRWRLWRKPVVGCHRWLWKEPAVMCGNWNVRQAMSQQVFRVTAFCINTCFQSFSTPISRIVHHTVLKSSPCRRRRCRKPQRVCIDTCSSCSVVHTQY